VVSLVHFNYNHTCNKRGQSQGIEYTMYVCSEGLLLRARRRLKDEGGFDEEEESD